VQARLILEGTKPETILEDWERVLKTKMKEWELERADMVRLFGTTRDKWMAEDLEVRQGCFFFPQPQAEQIMFTQRPGEYCWIFRVVWASTLTRGIC
jgi:hypothetical protein